MQARMAMAVPLRIAIYALGLLGAAVFDAVQGTGMDVTLAVAFGLGLHALATFAFSRSRYGHRK